MKYSSQNVFLFVVVLLTFLAPDLSTSPLLAQDLATVIEESEKSVVRIEVKGVDGDSLGSGFVVSNDGMFVTNVHVLAGAESARVIFPSGKSFQITGTLHIDAGRDICVARMSAAQTIPIKLADTLPRKGATVTALGAPLGLSFTATNGIISAIRDGIELGKDTGDESMKGTWVQVDAALSPGNSGGPLINKSGQVVAMSTRASSGRAQNLNFGISINDINAAIKKAESASIKSLSDGIQKVKMHDVGGAGPGGKIIKRREIPESSLKAYFDRGREDFADLSRDLRRKASAADKELKNLKRGTIGFPPGASYSSNTEVIVRQVRSVERFHFRSESVKRRVISRREGRVSQLKKLKEKLAKSKGDDALMQLLTSAGPRLDVREKNSIGFIDGAIVLHAFNDHEIVVVYDDVPVLMWVESSAGLAMGQELSPTPAFVAGTQTVEIPGKSSMSVTVLQAVTDAEMEKASFSEWKSKSGQHSIHAKLISLDGTKVKLLKSDGKEITIDISVLDEESQRRAGGK